MIFPKKQNIVLNNLFKAYVEGIYNDSPLNRKLGRVGMSYSEYANMISKEETHTKKREKNEIPINIEDLNFDKEGKAHYEVDDKKIDIELVSHVKYGDKNFTLKINGKEYKDLNTTQLTRRLKVIAKGKDFTDSNKKMSDTIPLTPEELDKLYGDIGFNYTYYKDNLDIKVWIREDSNKKDPRFNIYVNDSKTNKKKSFTNLNLLETHNKLLEYDLNPDIDKPLSKEQLRELKEIQLKQGTIKKNSYEVEPSKDIDIDFDEYGRARFKIDGNYYCELQVSRKNPSLINVIISNKKGEIEGVDYTNVDNFNNFLSNYDIELKKENQINLKDKDNVAQFIPPDKPLNEIIENYSDNDFLSSLLTFRFRTNPKYEPTKEDEKRLRKQIFDKKLGNFKDSKRDWNKDLRETYVFVNSSAFINWLKDMPSSNQKFSKRQIYNDIKELSNRFSGSGKIENIHSIPSLQYYIIKKYY